MGPDVMFIFFVLLLLLIFFWGGVGRWGLLGQSRGSRGRYSNSEVSVTRENREFKRV